MILPNDYEYDEDDLFYVYYEESTNIFYYDGGYINFLIYDILTPNEVFLFKKNKEDVLIMTKNGDLYMLYYEY